MVPTPTTLGFKSLIMQLVGAFMGALLFTPWQLNLADRADKALFKKVITNPAHVLHAVLPPERPLSLSSTLRHRPHNFQ